MIDACDGKDSLAVSPRVAVGVVVAQPDFPYSERPMADTDGVPIYGVTDENRKNLWPQSVKRMPQPVMANGQVEEAPTWSTAGDYVLVATGLGRTVAGAAERAYTTVKELQIADMIYRNDIGKRLQEQLPKLHALGYAREFMYDHFQSPLAEVTVPTLANEKAA
jgi:phosphoribosylamine---glycine ligase